MSEWGVIEYYIFLIRSLNTSATMVELSNGHFVPFFPQQDLIWDDGLNQVRELINFQSDNDLPQWLELRGLDEHEAWQILSGLPIEATGNKVEWTDVLSLLGLSANMALSEDAMRKLLLLAHPAKEEALMRIKQECGCDGALKMQLTEAKALAFNA